MIFFEKSENLEIYLDFEQKNFGCLTDVPKNIFVRAQMDILGIFLKTLREKNLAGVLETDSYASREILWSFFQKKK